MRDLLKLVLSDALWAFGRGMMFLIGCILFMAAVVGLFAAFMTGFWWAFSRYGLQDENVIGSLSMVLSICCIGSVLFTTSALLDRIRKRRREAKEAAERMAALAQADRRHSEMRERIQKRLGGV